jgi:hypothetical protein
MPEFTFNKKDVEAICKQYPQAFGGDSKTLDARRRLLIPIICRRARQKDGPVWFLINRLDRNDDDPRPGRLTADVIWHKPSNNHIDVLTSSGAYWEEHGPVTDSQWKAEVPENWPSWEDVEPVPEPEPEPGEPGEPSDTLDLRGARLEAQMKAIGNAATDSR